MRTGTRGSCLLLEWGAVTFCAVSINSKLVCNLASLGLNLLSNKDPLIMLGSVLHLRLMALLKHENGKTHAT